MKRSRLLILTALPLEARAITRAIGNVRSVEVHVVGLRGTRLPPIDPDTCVIVAGLGGALDPTLKVGDLVIDTALAGLPATLPWRVGPIHTAARLVTTPADKSTLFCETGALVVDMEHEAVRRAAPPGVPVIAVRAISDPANMAIDAAVLGFLDDSGRPQPLSVLCTLARRPRLVPHVIKLNLNSRKALRHLGLGIAALVIRFVHTGNVE